MSRSAPSASPPARPLWKRVGNRGRELLYRAASGVERAFLDESLLLPPLHLRVYYYGTWQRTAFDRAGEGVRFELTSRGLRPEHRVLDIGSGIGNLALSLRDYLQGGYDGVDIHKEAVTWCQRAITPRHPNFRFHHADLTSRAYNARGRADASTYRFPFSDGSFDFIFLGSVFTHLLPDATTAYVQEISRLLAPTGICVASYFLLNDVNRRSVDAGRSFMSFDVRHASGVCRLHDALVPESAVAFEETFVRAIHDEANLTIQDIRRGEWWTGRRHDQDVLTIVHRT